MDNLTIIHNSTIKYTNIYNNTQINMQEVILNSFTSSVFWLSTALLIMIIAYFLVPKKKKYELIENLLAGGMLSSSWILTYLLLFSVYGEKSIIHNIFLTSWFIIIIGIIIIRIIKLKKWKSKKKRER